MRKTKTSTFVELAICRHLALVTITIFLLAVPGRSSAAEFELSGRLFDPAGNPARAQILFEPIQSICSQVEFDFESQRVSTDAAGGYRVVLDDAGIWRMTAASHGGLEVKRWILPGDSARLPPLRLPNAKQRILTLLDSTRQMASGIAVSTDSRQTDDDGYFLQQELGSSDENGSIAIPLAMAKEQLQFSDHGVLEWSQDETTVTLRRISPRTDDGGSTVLDIEVVDETGAPIPNARVWNVFDPPCYGFTDARGYIRIEASSTFPRRFRVTANWFTSQQFQANPRDAIKIELSPAIGAIGGSIVDFHGKPIEDVAVEYDDARPPQYTGNDGRFEIKDLQVGQRLTLTAFKDGFVESRKERIAVEHEEDSEFANKWKLLRPSTVRGRVTSETGPPTSNLWIVLSGNDDVTTRVDSHGMFELEGVPPGDQVLVVSNEVGVLMAVPTFVSGSGTDVDAGEVGLGRGIKLTGQVLDKEGVPVDRASIFVDLQWQPHSSSEGPLRADGTARLPKMATSDESGFFEIPGLSSRNDVLLGVTGDGLQATEFVVPKEALLEFLDLQVERLTPIEVLVVSAYNQAPIPMARVSIDSGWQAPHHSTRPRSGQVLFTDYRGSVELEALPGSGVRIAVYADRYAFSERSVRIAPNDNLPFVLELDPEAEIHGQILSPAGSPVGGSINFQLVRDPESRSRSASVGDDGRFALTGLVAGETTVTIETRDFGRHSEIIYLAAGTQSETFVVNDSPRFSLEGRVIAAAEYPGILGICATHQTTKLESCVAADPSGDFHFGNLAAGSYAVRVYSPPRISVSAPRILQLTQDIGDLVLTADEEALAAIARGRE